MADSNYLSCISYKNKLIRWTDEKSTKLQVYIGSVLKYKKSDAEIFFRNLILKSLKSWKTALNNKINFILVDDPKNADIKFFWKWRSKFWCEKISLGRCYFQFNKETCSLYNAKVEINLTVNDIIGNEEKIFYTTLHETGHALGITDHSDQEGDIMHQYLGYYSTILSARDVNTINLLYTLPCGYSTIDKNIGRYTIKKEPLKENIYTLNLREFLYLNS